MRFLIRLFTPMRWKKIKSGSTSIQDEVAGADGSGNDEPLSEEEFDEITDTE